MEDLARLLTAVHLGLAATATLLVTAALAAAGPPRRALAPALFFVAATVAAVMALLRADARTAGPLDGVAAFALFTAPLLHPAPRALVGRAPLVALLAVPVLRLAGLDALAASRAGWLPPHFATTAAIIEGAAGLGAVVATLAVWRGGSRASRGAAAWCALSAASALATMALAWRAVRPMPAFEALYLGALLPLCAALHAGAAVTLRGRGGAA